VIITPVKKPAKTSPIIASLGLLGVALTFDFFLGGASSDYL